MGIFAGLLINPGFLFLIASIFILMLGFSISLVYNKGLENHLYVFPITYSFFLCGLLLYSYEKKGLSYLEPGTGEYLCSVSEYPEEKENSYKVIIKLYARQSENGLIPLNGSMIIYFRKDSLITSLLPGDFLKISCNPKSVVNRGNPNEFNYKFYLENHGIKYFSMAGADDIVCHIQPSHRKLRHKALIIREKIISIYRERGITDDRIGLVAAITLGQKNLLDQEQKQIFIRAGVMHIMAVSGLHSVILSIFIFNLLFFIKGKFNALKNNNYGPVIMVICICDRADSFGSKGNANVYIPSGGETDEKERKQHQFCTCFCSNSDNYPSLSAVRCRIPSLLFCGNLYYLFLSQIFISK